MATTKINCSLTTKTNSLLTECLSEKNNLYLFKNKESLTLFVRIDKEDNYYYVNIFDSKDQSDLHSVIYPNMLGIFNIEEMMKIPECYQKSIKSLYSCWWGNSEDIIASSALIDYMFRLCFVCKPS